jgi:serine/threonine protein phosphatase 1
MIDRGPASAGLLAYIRIHPQIVCIKGNHEQMAAQCIQSDGSFQAWKPWMERGGKSTYGSYIVQAEGDLWKAKRAMIDDFTWLDALPTQLVLDHVRLVHAGYDPRMPLDIQGEKELLWIRKEWFTHEAPVDSSRTVFFGHTTTTKLGDAAGEVALSSVSLPDGRPAWVGIDVGAYNHVAPGLAAIDIASLAITKQPTLQCDRWFERLDTRPMTKKKNKKRVWKAMDDRKEADVAIHFGLKSLATRAYTSRGSSLRARQALEEAGVVFNSEYLNDGTRGASQERYRIFKRKQATQQSDQPSWGPTSFRTYRKRPSGGGKTPGLMPSSTGFIPTP